MALVNPNLDNGLEHRIGANLYPWDYNDTCDKECFVPDLKAMINKTYDRCLESQEATCNIDRYWGYMKDFSRNHDINIQYNLSYNSYTLEFPIRNVNFFNTKKVRMMNPRTYTMKEMCQRTDLFERQIWMFIDGNVYTDLKVYIDQKKVLLIIEAANDSMNLNKIKEYTNPNDTFEWVIVTLPFATRLSYSGTGFNLISDSTKIMFSKFNKDTNSMFIDKNLWVVSFSTTDSSSIRTSFFAPLSYDADNKPYFSIPRGHGEYMRTRANLCVSAYAMPDLKGSILLMSARTFEIALDKNPVSPKNIMVWECFDYGTDITSYEYLNNVTVEMYYPNVYKIVNAPTDAFLVVMWNYAEISTTRFDNPIKEYMSYNTHYASDAIGDVLPKILKEYIPYKSVYHNERYYLEYFNQATRFGEYQYKLKTMKELIKDNPRRLCDVYEKYVVRNAYEWHSNPKYSIKISEWGKLDSRVRTSTSDLNNTTITFDNPHVLFTLDHEDERIYKISLWIDGLYTHTDYIFNENCKTFIYVPRELISDNSIIDFEIMKVRGNDSKSIELDLPTKDNSIKIPRGLFKDISPQNMMIAIREETAYDDDGRMQYIWRVADDYEMYWLLFGSHEYASGIRTDIPYVTDSESNPAIITYPEDGAIAVYDTGVIAVESTPDQYLAGKESYFLQRGGYPDGYFMTKNTTDNTIYDFFAVGNIGYYGDERRRFYKYLSYDKETDPNIFITPITSFFAGKHVKLINTDVYSKRVYQVTSEDPRIKIPKFILDPSVTKFRIFVNGLLCNPYTDYLIDVNTNNTFYMDENVNIAITNTSYLKSDSLNEVVCEYIPYKYVCLYSIRYTGQALELRHTMIKRPFSLSYYDIYVNGKKCSGNDIVIKSPSKLYFNIPIEDAIISFYERAHDQEIYGNTFSNIKSIIDKIADEDGKFRNYMLSQG